MFIGLRSYHHWQRREVLLQLQECFNYFLNPNKGSGFLQQLEERESPLCQSRDKLVERDQAPREILDIINAGWRLHLFDCLDLLWVGLDSPVQNQEAEQLSSKDPKHILV
jgi:hypothetical protein